MVAIAGGVKRCALCDEAKSLHEFYRDRRGVYSARCNRCHGLLRRTCTVCGSEFVGKSSRRSCSPECHRRCVLGRFAAVRIAVCSLAHCLGSIASSVRCDARSTLRRRAARPFGRQPQRPGELRRLCATKFWLERCLGQPSAKSVERATRGLKRPTTTTINH